MDKSTHFFGKSVFGQLISLIDSNIITSSAKKHNSDRYIKKFKTKDHLISMLFCSFAKCTSLREVSGAMLGLSGKTKHFQLSHIPKRSTLSDANKRRDADVFGDIYNKLLRQYGHYISDSRIKDVINKQIKIFDSSTISLFKDILKCVGRNSQNGKKKGGIKLRKVQFYDRILKRRFEFLTNLFEIRADLIAAIYKLRWQIELLFKQLKQNFPLKYFIGDNENAIKIQIYCALIANLLMTVIQKMLKRKWGFSNLVSFCKIHLFNYIHLLKFLENPDKDWQKTYDEWRQPSLF